MIGVILILVAIVVLNLVSNSLSILAVSGIVTLVSYKYKTFFKKAYIFYIIAILLAAVSAYFYEESWTYVVTKGIIGYGFLLVVMFVGALPNKWTVSRNIKMYRGVFSILAFILISPHALLRVFGLLGSVNLFGIAAYVVMVPLTIISFQVIRKEIDVKDWIKIQKGAYLIYGILFAHLLLVASYPDKIIYAVILTLYLNNKLLKEFRK